MLLFPKYKLCINFGKKNWLGDILGNFFTNSSGHPGGSAHDLLDVKGKIRNSFFLSLVLKAVERCEQSKPG
jgi:hypothetical protein